MPEKEYIEREAVLSILDGLYQKHLTMHNYSVDSATLDCIEAAIESPTADVAEVKHGEWKVEEYPKQNKKYLICRNCTAVIDCNEIRIDENEFDFCPYCGADMRGD